MRSSARRIGVLGLLCCAALANLTALAPTSARPLSSASRGGRGLRAGFESAQPFRQALPGYRFQFPRDHFSHPEFQTEWWYYTGNLRSHDGRRLGFELTFFRQAADRSRRASTLQSAPAPGETQARPSRPSAEAGQVRQGASSWDVRDVYLAHFALSDIDGGTFHHAERVNRAGPGIAGIDPSSGTIWNGNWSARIEGNRHALAAVAPRFRLSLELDSQKPPVIQGVDAVSQKAEGPGQASHYVSFTRLVGKGAIEVGGRRLDVEGTAWMDHEFFSSQMGPDQRGWDWLGLQLDDGSELMVYRLRRNDGTADRFSSGTVIEKDGRSVHLRAADFTMTPAGETWVSPASQAVYPVAWRIAVPSHGLDLAIRTPLASQELAGRLGFTPVYWEGSVSATGSRRGTPVAGIGYLEMTGYDKSVRFGQ
jgi:predicted secreted hydrolase